jgi:DNA invertase Pin-like site-specific DNA recombinase
MDTTTPHGALLFSIFGALAQYELTRERVIAGLAAAKRHGRRGGRPSTLSAEQIAQITAALDGGASKASVRQTFKAPRSTLLDTLKRVGPHLCSSLLKPEPKVARSTYRDCFAGSQWL